MRAGLPATTAYGGTDSTTTAPAPTIAPRPIVMPGSIVALAPIDAPSLTIVVRNFVGGRLLRGKRSFANVALGPMKTSSSMRTPSQSWTPHFTVTRSPTMTSFSMNVWSQMLQSAPMRAPAARARRPRRACAARSSFDSHIACGCRNTEDSIGLSAAALRSAACTVIGSLTYGLRLDASLFEGAAPPASLRLRIAIAEREPPAHDRERPRLRVLERAPCVRADDREAERVERAEARDQQHRRRITGLDDEAREARDEHDRRRRRSPRRAPACRRRTAGESAGRRTRGCCRACRRASSAASIRSCRACRAPRR